MHPTESIRAFLAAVRRRLCRREAGYWAAIGGAVAGMALLAAPLAAGTLAPAWSGAIRIAALAFLGGAALATLALGLVLPRRRFRDEREVARFVGTRHPQLASDLLSAVELQDQAPRSGRASPDLVAALLESTGTRLRALDPRETVPYRPLRRPLAGLLATATIYTLALLAAPGALSAGWRHLALGHASGPLEGAERVDEPLVGDIHVTLHYPDYTGREPAELPNTSGEFRAMPGTRVEIETLALAPADEARILFDDPEGNEEKGRDAVPMQVEGRELSASFEVMEGAHYRFYLERGSDQRVEGGHRRISLERDRVPTVELHAPDRELDVTDMKRIELAYVAEDDYGLSEINLVWESEREGEPQKKALSLSEDERRSAESKFLWDLADVSLEPGARIAYHVEARDNDDVKGPKVGRSETYYLRVFSPREQHEQALARQRELFEDLVHNLADRLQAPSGDPSAHDPIQRDTAQIVAGLGGVIATMEEEELADETLLRELEGVRERLRAMSDAEREILETLSERERDVSPRLARRAEKSAATMEDDVLLLADWLDRQQLENLLALSDEVDSHKERLEELLEEYERAGSDEVREEIERELRALERRLAELASSQESVPSDVMDDFVNEEALVGEPEESCVEKVRERIESGEIENAKRELEGCAKSLDQSAQALEDSLGDLRGERFSAEEQAFGELMNELADLERDQEAVADEADELWERYTERAAERMADEAEATRREVQDKLEELSDAVDRVPESGLTPFSREELDAVKGRVSDLEEMLEEGDIAEALAMARQAEAGLEAMGAELEASLAEDDPWSDRSEEAADRIGEAQPLARDVVEALKQATPEPWEIMSPEDRKALDELRRRQEALRDKAESLAERAEDQAGELPGNAGPAISESVGEAGEPMGRAVRRMLARDPSGARQESRDAAERLAEAREQGQGEARRRGDRGAGRIDDEPVRIPGAGEYEAPEAFRQDLLEAMKEDDPPERYRELVRRYYEELIE